MKTYILILAAAMLLLSGCGMLQTPVQPPVGGLFTEYRAPLSVEFNDTPVGSKSGSATMEYINIPFFGSWSFAWGDNSVESAAANGKLKEVYYSDYEYFNVLWIYSKVTTVAHGD